MRLTAIILLSACITASAKTGAQGITLSVKNASLERVFAEIKKQTGYSFVYNNSFVSKTKISLTVSRATVDEVLALALKDQPLSYEIIDRTIVIKPKSPNGDINTVISNDSEKSPPPIDITGKVTDENGNPLAGASVKVKGSTKGTTTDNDGVFVLKGVDDNAVLEISYVGFEQISIPVSNRTSIVTSLKAKPENLNEVIINKGAYTEKQRFSVSNVGHIDGKVIQNQPVQNPLLAIEGRVPGLQITQLSGINGGGVTVRIEGQNSISKDLNPLIVVDGVPYPAQFISPSSSESSLIQGGSPLNFIDPSDIEAIDVLKDADATAIYGSRAANGAILITTKKGKVGKMKMSINLQQGWGKVTRHVDMMNTRQYLDMRYEALKNDGLSLGSLGQKSSTYDLTLWDTSRYTNWQKTLIGGTAKYSRANISITGGTATMQYLIRANYNRQTSVFPGDFDDKNGGLNVNLNASSLNQKFKIELSASYMLDKNLLPSVDLTNQAIVLAPDAPALYNDDGTLNWAPNAAGSSTWSNPLRYKTQADFDNTSKGLISNLNLIYKISRELGFSFQSGYNSQIADIYIPTRLNFYSPEQRPTATLKARYGSRNMGTWIAEPQINFKKHLGKGNIEALIGSNIQESTSNVTFLDGSGYTNDLMLKSPLAATTITITQNFSSIYKYNALYCRANYNWNEKYIFNLTARRDGSSRFGDANRFNNFWSVGGGWVFSNEKRIQNNISFLSFGKLRASYGTTGNDGISDYSYLGLYSISNGAIPYQGGAGLSLNSLPNPHLEWEETRKIQGGVDLSFLKDRVLMNVTYVRNRSSNQLASYKVPSITGLSGITQNLSALIQNTGWEFMINTMNVKSKHLKWTSSFNLTIPRNKLVSFPSIGLTPYTNPANGVIVGKPLGTVVVLPFGGVDPATGKYLFLDANGNPTTGAGAVQNIFVNTLTKYYGGFQNGINYRGFQIDFFFQFIRQKGPRQLFYYNGSSNPGLFSSSNASNQPVSALNRWQKPGDVVFVTFYTTNIITIRPISTEVWYNYDASYIRLKNLSLSWELPAKWLSKIHISSGHFYFQGQNVATITKFTGLDPETQSLTSLPPLQMWTLGAQIDF